MNDAELLDEFFTRLQADPNLSPIAIILGPYRAMMREPAAMVVTLDALAAHWAATRGEALPVESSP